MYLLKEKKDNLLGRYLLPNIFVFPAIIALFVVLYCTNPEAFASLSKILIFCMSIYLISNSLNTRIISSNVFLSGVTFFYGAINCLQAIHLIFIPFVELAPSSNIRIYYLSRIAFALGLICLAILYRHKRTWIWGFISLWSLILIGLGIWTFNRAASNSIFLIREQSFWSQLFILLDQALMPTAILGVTFYLRKLLATFPFSHRVIWYTFLGCSLVMELVNWIPFLPITITNGPLLPHLFKITILYIFIMGQVDCCILRPFSNMYIHEYHNNQRIHTALEELFRYSNYVSELEQTLEAKSSSIYELINIFPEPVLICYEDRILNANQAALTLLECGDAMALQTASILEYISDSSELLGSYVSQMKTEMQESFYSDGTLTTLSGKKYAIEYILAPTSLFDRHSTLCIIRDVSDKKHSEEAQRHIHEQEFKLSYLSNLSHDLKAPLNIIYSALQMQSKSQDLTEIHHYSEIMQQNTLKLLRMIVNLLDLNKASQNMLTLKSQVINVVDKYEELCMMSQSYIETHQLSYIFDTTTEERLVAIDPQIFERIILNLISNAIKYTPSNGQLFFNLTDTPDTISLHIRDTGVGISEDILPFIFDRFTKDRHHPNTPNTHDKSYGMGLSIVKELVTLLGGTITCQSILGVGSEFIVTLPTPPLPSTDTEIAATELSSINLRMEFYDI
ncbi:MAG: sensor histidine kinase [Cellulosilyticaceae bacterium]